MTLWIPDTEPVGVQGHLNTQIFGHDLSRAEAAREIERGLPTQVFERFLTQFPNAAKGSRETLKLSERTLSRRRQAGRFTPEESDRLYRLIGLYLQATDVLESAEAADQWMTSPALGLGNQRPLTVARNEAGSKEVHDLLVRIDHGVYS